MFKDDFLWGAASAAYQVEGAYDEDGKGTGIWDHFTQDVTRCAHGENGNIACDHYHRYKEDVALMKEIGLKSYRFSINWTRVIPEGCGKVNEAGLRFYSDLVDELIGAGIEPMVTLFHWNYPYELYRKGGWKNADSPEWFAQYVKVVVDALSDRVRYWFTFNEPQLFLGGGHKIGFHAPFEENSAKDMMTLYRNVFLAHGKAVSAIRRNAKLSPMIGMAPTGSVCIPTDRITEDEARQRTFDFDSEDYFFSNAWWADPIMLGRFTDCAREVFGDDLISFTKEEWELVSQPLDYYAFNVYQAQTDMVPDRSKYDDYSYIGSPRTTTDWNVTPEVLYYAPKFFYERYKKPIMITENGMANTDWEFEDGKVHDPQRIDFLSRYLKELKRATDDGIPVLGYQYWSIMDNFEWTSGYDKRFGMIYVDYRTGKRTLKDSALWYADVIRSNGSKL